MPVWPTIERFITEHGAAVLVTLAEVQGSSPREVGARMVVRPDGGVLRNHRRRRAGMDCARRSAGDAGDAAQDFRRLDKALGPDLGQCCGGRVRLTLERFDPRRSRRRSPPLADAERAGRFMTVASIEAGKRLVRHVAVRRRSQDIRRCRLHEIA